MNENFQLTLTSHVSAEDFQMGYSMTGTVERSQDKYTGFQTTHMAFVRRKPATTGNRKLHRNSVASNAVNQVHPAPESSAGYLYGHSPAKKISSRKMNYGRKIDS